MREWPPVTSADDDPLILFIVGTLLPGRLIGHWAHRDVHRHAALASRLVAPRRQNPEVQAGIAQTLTDLLITVDGAAAR